MIPAGQFSPPWVRVKIPREKQTCLDQRKRSPLFFGFRLYSRSRVQDFTTAAYRHSDHRSTVLRACQHPDEHGEVHLPDAEMWVVQWYNEDSRKSS